MASETEITVRGRLGFNPELQLTAGKKAWMRLRVATNRRIRNGDVWTDGPTSWYDVKLFGDFAQNVAESVHKGDAVIVQGELSIDEYTNASGVTLRSPVIHARAFGPDLAAATARVTRVQRNSPDTRVGGAGEPQASGAPAEGEDLDREVVADEAELITTAPVDVSQMEELDEADRAFFAKL